MKKIKRKILLLLISAIFILVLVGILLPVKFDAGACGGGFRSYVVDLYLEELEEIVQMELGDNYVMLSNSSDIADSVSWNGRIIQCKVEYKILGEKSDGVVSLDFVGTRYWFERYDWKLSDEI